MELPESLIYKISEVVSDVYRYEESKVKDISLNERTLGRMNIYNGSLFEDKITCFYEILTGGISITLNEAIPDDVIKLKYESGKEKTFTLL